MTETVAVLGASPNPQRYSFKAVELLQHYGHRVLPVNPYHSEVAGVACVTDLSQVSQVDTVTLYVNPALLEKQIEALLALAPGRVIFNPGSEAPALAARLQAAGIATEDACTLVLLRTGQY